MLIRSGRLSTSHSLVAPAHHGGQHKEKGPPLSHIIIRPDRSAVSSPEGVSLLYPAFETAVSPDEVEYDLMAQVAPWLHEGQKDGSAVTGTSIYTHLKDGDILRSCLGYLDALAIRQAVMDEIFDRGNLNRFNHFFQTTFGSRTLYFWRGIGRRLKDGQLVVPGLYLDQCHTAIWWRSIGREWNALYPALRFKIRKDATVKAA